jgi:predicted nucleic acid-binding Zn ribbon protein
MEGEMTTTPIAALRSYVAEGLCALPAIPAEKRPSVGTWRQYRDRLPTAAEMDAWETLSPKGVCIVCGQASDNGEIIDFDAGGELFNIWRQRIPSDLLAMLVIERTPSGGYHVWYRCQSAVCGNLKLAQRKVGDKIVTLIETRGEGGLFLCAPTPGYQVIKGDLAAPPTLAEAQRDLLLHAAWNLNEYLPDAVNGPKQSPPAGHRTNNLASLTDSASRPGDDFNMRGDVRAILQNAGWSMVKGGDNEYWRRPGKDSGTSATLREGVFYVFSSNAAPFEANQAYSPFAVYAVLTHGGDYEQAASSLRLLGYGNDSLPNVADGVDISGLVGHRGHCAADNADIAPPAADTADPGPMSADMLRMPGFVGEVMDYCLETAPYPNPVMAFAGALSLQAFLAGRKVRDPGDNRTNVYLLGLAHSAAGKDWPRKINTQIVHHAGLSECLGERFASGEGIQDALFQTPSMLYQTDEIDGMLQSINKSKDARHEAVLSTLLTMYSSANSIYPMRRKAGKDATPGVIDQPSLTIFGTAIPNHYYEALSERMLTNGFFARMIILESGHRGGGQEPRMRDLPPRVLASARWWGDYQPGERRGNLLTIHPVPAVVEHDDQARDLLIQTRELAEGQYAKAEESSDPVGTTVWGRVSEHIRKLALIYAVSQDHQAPKIGRKAVEWASQFVLHQTRRMLFMASAHVADNPFEADCLKAVQKIRESPSGKVAHSVLLKRMKMPSKAFKDLMETLVHRGDIQAVSADTQGRPMLEYTLTSFTPQG